MRKPILGLAVLLLATAAFAADDWNLWTGYGLKVPVYKDKVKLATKFETRWRDDMDEFFRYHFYVGPEWKVLKNLTLAAKYGNIQSGDPGDFHTEHRGMFHVIPSVKLKDLGIEEWRLGDLSLKVDNRLDWRYREHKSHTHTWRWKLYPTLSYPVYKSEKLTVSPYTANAFYFDFTDGWFYNQNRVYGGLKFKLFKKFSLSWYYMYLTDRKPGEDWGGSHVIGTNVSYDF